MIVAILAEKNINTLLDTIQSVPNDVDVIELRLDFLSEFTVESIKAVMIRTNKPVILTLRASQNGGYFKGTESARLGHLKALAALNPAYIDLESSIHHPWIEAFHRAHPAIQIIRSYHHFTETPKSLEGILESMRHPAVTVYKIITYATTSLDNLRILNFLKQHTPHIKLTAHCIGPLGLPSRIMGSILGNIFDYAAMNNIPAPNCPDLDTLLTIYHVKQLNVNTVVFALLGDPVEHSVGHIFHNQQFKQREINAVYLKMALKPDELPAFFKAIQDLPFKGFSITTPLKEKIMPYVDLPDKKVNQIGSTNTIRIENNVIYATHTDGVGAVDVLETKRLLSKSHILMIGAGGAAKAIAHACAARNPLSLHIVNRTLSKAVLLAEKINAKAYDATTFKTNAVEQIDMIINAIPHTRTNDAFVLELMKPYLSSEPLIMQVDYSNSSKLPCTLGPIKMFESQAIKQQQYWCRN